MTCDCSIDVDYSPDFFVSNIVTARTTHKCCECQDEIRPREQYEKVTGKWEGELDTFHTCQPCKRIRDDYCCGGYEFGGLWEALHECLGIDYDGRFKE